MFLPTIALPSDQYFVGDIVSVGTSVAQSFGFSSATPSSIAPVTVSLGSKSAVVNTTRSVAAAVFAQLTYLSAVNNVVSFDNTSVIVLVTVSDASGQFPTLATSVTLTISLAGKQSLFALCVTSASTSSCTVSFDIPSSWFSKSAQIASATLNVAGAAPMSGTPLRLASLPVLQSTTPTIAVYLPQQPLHAGDVFVVNILANTASSAITGALSFAFTVDSSLIVDSVSTDQLSWYASVTQSSTQVSFAAVAQTGASIQPSQPITQIALRVASNAHIDVTAGIVVSAVAWYASTGASIMSSFASPVVYLGGASPQVTTGAVFIRHAGPVFMRASVFDANLVNTAVFTGISVVSSISVASFDAAGNMDVSTTGLSCTSSDLSIVKVTGSCTSVFLNGYETRGGSAIITVTSTQYNLTTTIPITVWFPLTNSYAIQVTDSTLNAVTGWSSQACAQAYQVSNVQVTARFTTDKASTTTLTITNMISRWLSSSNTAVFTVIQPVAGQSSVQVSGVAPGTGKLLFKAFSGAFLAQASVTVTDDTVYAVKMHAVAVESLQVSIDQSLSFLGFSTLTTSIASTLSYSYQQAFISSVVVFSDGTQMSLDAQSVSVVSNDNNLLVNGRLVSALGSGSSTLTVSWINKCQTNVAITSTSIGMQVSMNAPIALSIVLSANTITSSTDAASLFPSSIPTSSRATVFATYASGVVLDVTTDARTAFSLADPSSFFSIHTSASGVFVQTSAWSAVPVSRVFTASFNGISASASISAVFATTLTVNTCPYPMFDGSKSITLASINRLGLTSAYQQAFVQVTMTRSDGVKVDLSFGANAAINVLAPTTMTASTLATLTSVPEGIVLNKSPNSSLFGDVTVMVNFGSLSASTTVKINDGTIPVVSIYDVQFPSTVIAKTSLDLAVIFGDGSRIPSFYGSGLAAVPGLVSFEYDAAYISINATTGVVTPVKSSPYAINLIAIAQTTTGAAVSSTLSSVVNIAPTLGDLHIGSIGDTIAIPPVTALNSLFYVPMTINLQDASLLATQFSIYYDPKVLRIVDVNAGSDWSGSQFFYTINDPVGTILIGGFTGTITGLDVQVAVLTFSAIGGSGRTTTLTASVQSMVSTSNGVIGAFEGKTSAAANVDVIITPNARRSTSTAPVTTTSTPSTAAKTCTSPAIGDANFDCVVNIRDAVFIASVLVSSRFNPSFINSLPAAQVAAMNVDKSGVVSMNDVHYLVRAIFNRYRMLQSDITFSSQYIDNTCLYTIAVHLSHADGSIPAINSTMVLFDVASNDTSVSAMLPTRVTQGSFVASSSSVLNGNVYASTTHNDGVYFISFIGAGFDLSQSLDVSIVIVTFDAYGNNDNSRVTPLIVSHIGTPLYSAASINVNVAGITKSTYTFTIPMVSSTAYSPLARFNASTVNMCHVSVSAPPTPVAGSSASSSVGMIGLVALVVVPAILIALYVYKKRRSSSEFFVRVVKKHDDDSSRPDKHPNAEDGCDYGYEISTSKNGDFTLGGEMWVVRGRTYTFHFASSVTKDFPFYISTSDVGGGNGALEYLEGVENSPAFHGYTLKFTPSLDCPDVLYYQCTKRKAMGYKMYAVDSQAQVGHVAYIPRTRNEAIRNAQYQYTTVDMVQSPNGLNNSNRGFINDVYSPIANIPSNMATSPAEYSSFKPPQSEHNTSSMLASLYEEVSRLDGSPKYQEPSFVSDNLYAEPVFDVQHYDEDLKGDRYSISRKSHYSEPGDLSQSRYDDLNKTYGDHTDVEAMMSSFRGQGTLSNPTSPQARLGVMSPRRVHGVLGSVQRRLPPVCEEESLSPYKPGTDNPNSPYSEPSLLASPRTVYPTARNSMLQASPYQSLSKDGRMPLSPLNKSSISAGAMSPNGNDQYMTLNRSSNAAHTDDQYMTLQRASTGSTLLGSFNAVAANFNRNSFQQPPSKRVSIVSGDGEIYDGTYLNADGILMRKHSYLKSLKTLKVPGYKPAPSYMEVMGIQGSKEERTSKSLRMPPLGSSQVDYIDIEPEFV